MTEPWERLRLARQRARLSGPAAAARKFGWNVATYTSHENGTRGLRLGTAQRYAKAFRVSAGWLLTGIDHEAGPSSPDEVALLTKYRMLPEDGRRAVRAVLNSYFEQVVADLEQDGPFTAAG